MYLSKQKKVNITKKAFSEKSSYLIKLNFDYVNYDELIDCIKIINTNYPLYRKTYISKFESYSTGHIRKFFIKYVPECKMYEIGFKVLFTAEIKDWKDEMEIYDRWKKFWCYVIQANRLIEFKKITQEDLTYFLEDEYYENFTNDELKKEIEEYIKVSRLKKITFSGIYIL